MSCPACTVHCTHRTLYSTPARCRPVSRSPAAAVRRVRRAPRSCTPASAPPPVVTWRSLTLKSHATRDSDDIMMSCRPRIKHQTAVCRARPLQLQGPGGGVTRCRSFAAAAISPDPVWCSSTLTRHTAEDGFIYQCRGAGMPRYHVYQCIIMHEAAFLAPIIGGARGVIMARDALGAVIDLMDRSATSNQPPPSLCCALSDAESSREVVMEIRREKRRHQAAPPRGEEIQHTAATETL